MNINNTINASISPFYLKKASPNYRFVPVDPEADRVNSQQNNSTKTPPVELNLSNDALAFQQQVNTERVVQAEADILKELVYDNPDDTKESDFDSEEDGANSELEKIEKIRAIEDSHNNGPHAEENEDDKSKTDDSGEQEKAASSELTEEELKEVEDLKQRDQEVRTHEQAHLAAAGPYSRGGIHYDMQTGPDHNNYAVGGHVNIDVSEESTPEKTIAKMKVVQRSALAPAEPSPQDYKVANKAAATEAKARQELAEELQEKGKPDEIDPGTTKDASAEGSNSEVEKSQQEIANNKSKIKAFSQFEPGKLDYRQQINIVA